ncbi:MAG: hypothetical protein KDE58_33220, partial [Caldilineaceae bacterium]|nr:hypothetical protein [Caldilineaceae bacterium]
MRHATPHCPVDERRPSRRWTLVTLPLTLSSLFVAFFALHPIPLAAFPAGQQAGSSPTHAAPTAFSPTIALTETIAPGGFVPVGAAVFPTTADAHDPALAIQPDSTDPWLAATRSDRIVVSNYSSATMNWQQQGGILNRGSANVASNPALTFAGTNAETPWVAWQEDVGGVSLINASSFNGATWNLTPLLNRDPAHSATQPMIVAGATVTGAVPLPWVTWVEEDDAGTAQLVVSRAVPDNRVQGGFAWVAVGGTLNLAPTRPATAPDLAFAGSGNTVPWVVWRETGGAQAERIYAKRWDGSAWRAVGRQEGCGDAVACALNSDPNVAAGGVRIATGTLPNESVAMPWLVYQEVGFAGQQEIRVLRLDPGDPGVAGDDRLIPVGGAVNSQCLGNAGVSAAAANNVDVRSA